MKFDHALVLGGGLAGMLTAAALARHCAAVTVVERDRLPDGPLPRKGTPQAHHAHLLMAGGAQAVDELVPGTLAALYEAGARRIGLPEDLVALTAHGWQTRFPASHFLVSCGRPLLDWVVRRQVLRDERIVVRTGTETVRLLGDASRVTGADVRGENGGETVSADLVVDTTGRASRARNWLLGLGIPPVRSDSVDSGLVYATRIFQAPEGTPHTFPLITIMSAPDSAEPGRNGVLLPVENGQWIVTVSGTRGGEPPVDEAGFLTFAHSLRHSLIGELIEDAEPLTGIYSSRSTVNRRVHYDRVSRWPEGLLVLGDALAAFNPVYGHGMSCAAIGARALERVLAADPEGGTVARKAQQAVAEGVRDAWALATRQDIRYPGARVQLADRSPDVSSGISDALERLALVDPVVSAASYAINTLSESPAGVISSRILDARRGPVPEPPAEPPIKPGELPSAGCADSRA
ncbi:FAD-dependent oxidoreductase [Streptomyces sp. Inha503]|uniref:FAD-dependent oxidoreductase n=1 Tax=Streptomyces sp. Inha503 TaxID=3383314 RepID=UPI0039A0DD38